MKKSTLMYFALLVSMWVAAAQAAGQRTSGSPAYRCVRTRHPLCYWHKFWGLLAPIIGHNVSNEVEYVLMFLMTWVGRWPESRGPDSGRV